MNRQQQNGFSLVELSIVLIIVAFLIGGILMGKSMITAAELGNISSELQLWQSAAKTFKQKYSALPGDFSNATDYWSTTGEGDGDGRITNGGAGGGEEEEFFLFWQHLALAGLISGEYTGVAGSGGVSHHVAGQNTPLSAYGEGGWTAESVEASIATRYLLPYKNALLFGKPTTTGTTSSKILSPEEAWGIDTKIDDGKPGSGNVIGLHISDCTTASGNTDYTSTYERSDILVQCALYFRNGI